MKKITIKEHIINYAKSKYYFNINDLKQYFARKGIEFKKNTLKQCLYLLKKDGLIYEAGRGWYSTIKEKFVLDTKPVEKIISLIKNKFPLLEFSCWSTEQIKGFFHHLPSQFVIFVYTDKDFLQSLKDFLTDNDYNVYLNPLKIEAEKYVELKAKTVVLRPSISSREPKHQHMAKIEKIITDLFMETKKLNLIDIGEYKKIVSNIVLNYRVDMAMVLDYAYNRKIKDRIQSIIREFVKLTNATFR
ncbi:hypothetical protein CH333_01785 [candidate division WOR-3 bacterium JGI_Cruoil_03_44_89]|uniref:Uncharacterized protein n=1 Tax=candidate division WOR-3 bacterium JGI_Cruoil_03_44_89 TaxID=1973748 RepID=A0A235BXV1_UNCW3|nr:MAG: hypothetical protein CH333_01785 [candidate division WOR-3 bacterium JGI_Cruoil_03_44_89]